MERRVKKKTQDTEGTHSSGDRWPEHAEKLGFSKCIKGESKDASGEVGGQRFQQLFGFSRKDLQSWGSFVRLLSRPSDPACLAYIRFSFGILLFLDVFKERGLTRADFRWGNPEECRFPLFGFLQPLPLHFMVLLYFVMIIGTMGIALGVQYRLSCLLHLLPYWYMLLLEKSVWNNHSYLFGILSFLLLLCDANRYWSLDGLFSTRLHNTDVPLWNYTLLRAQVFLVYFLAGLKKLDMDWVGGYSMTNLGEHWVFNPFKLVLTQGQVDFLVVHLGGLTIDLFMGFLLFFDKTRLLGVLISSAFHLMNSQMFSIGMFPYGMLALTPLFFYANWPRGVFRLVPRALRVLTPDHEDDDTQPSPHCLYTKEQAKTNLLTDYEETEGRGRVLKQRPPPTRPSFRHHAAAVFSIFFIVLQLCLPYSHFITKGYNSWTQGLYGYSWDMMVHYRNTQHIRITFVDKDTGQRGYLDPEVWSRTNRWVFNPGMMKEYALCIAKHLHQHDIHHLELYFDIWVSLNHRFQQRIVNPHVDMMTAEWSVFKATPWIMPLLVDLSDWRTKLFEIQEQLYNSTHLYEVVFVADFPGMHLENYVSPGIGNFTISVLKGQVVVEVIPEDNADTQPYNISVQQGQEAQIPTGLFHKVHTVSEEPSCYMYLYINREEITFLEKLKEFEQSLNGSLDNPVPDKFAKDPKVDQYIEVLKARRSENSTFSFTSNVTRFLHSQYFEFVRGLRLVKGALWSVYSGSSFQAYVKELNKDMENTLNTTDGKKITP